MRTLPTLLLLAAVAAAQDRPLAVGTKEAAPFAMKGPDGEWTGIAIELWRRIAEDLGREYEWRELPLPGILDGVADGSLDAAVAALSVTPDREQRMDFSHPFHSSGLGIAVPARRGGWFADIVENLVSTRFLGALGALLLLLGSVGVAVWFLERRRNPDHFGGSTAQGIGNGLWWSAVTMTTVGYGDKAPVTLPGRLVALVWMFASVILVAGFTAAIASSLTVRHLETEIRGPGDLPGRRIASVAGSSSEAYLRRKGLPFDALPSAKDAILAVARGDADAAVYDAPLLRYLARIEGEGQVAVLPGVFEKQGYAIALPRDSELRKPVNQALLRIVASADWEETLRSYLGD